MKKQVKMIKKCNALFLMKIFVKDEIENNDIAILNIMIRVMGNGMWMYP